MVVVGGILSWFVIGISFEPVLIAGGSAPGTIWGAGVDKTPVLLGAGLLLVAAGVLRGRFRIVLLLGWLLFLADATHRLIERSDGQVDDIWLAVPIQTLPAATGEFTQPRCRISRWQVRCGDGAGQTLTSPTLIPFVSLLPGRWERAAAAGGRGTPR
ncbi:hypothetical protein [Sphingomonas sp. PB4P5]|uniref:hypothetical protein n=1 Tax=Parasphingomonas puruogangriensis TaxID=3096155 RepID=UPI002FCC5CE4